MRTLARCALAASAFALLGATDVDAQSVTGQPVLLAVSSDAPKAGPTMAAAAAGVRAVSPAPAFRSDVSSAIRQERRVGAGRNVALMVVGGAAVVAGLLIGDDAGALLAVGGAVVGLYGLYQFVR